MRNLALAHFPGGRQNYFSGGVYFSLFFQFFAGLACSTPLFN